MVSLVDRGSFAKICFDMVKSKEFGNLVKFFQVRDNLIRSALVNLCEIWLGDSFRCKLRDDQ